MRQKTIIVLVVGLLMLTLCAGTALVAVKFQPARYYPTGPFPVSATSADFNGDGRDDLATPTATPTAR